MCKYVGNIIQDTSRAYHIPCEIKSFVVGLTDDEAVNALIIVSEMVVELLIDALTEIIRGVLTNIGVDVLVNVFVDLMPAFEFAMPGA